MSSDRSSASTERDSVKQQETTEPTANRVANAVGIGGFLGQMARGIVSYFWPEAPGVLLNVVIPASLVAVFATWFFARWSSRKLTRPWLPWSCAIWLAVFVLMIWSALLVWWLLLAPNPCITWGRIDLPPTGTGFAPPLDLIEDELLGREYPGGPIFREQLRAWRRENSYDPPDVQWVAYESSDLRPRQIPIAVALAEGLEAVLGAYLLARADTHWTIAKVIEPREGQTVVRFRIGDFEGDSARIVVFVFPLTSEAYRVVRQDFGGFSSVIRQEPVK